MKSTKLEILKMIMEDLQNNNYVVPKYTGYQYNDVLSVIKGLKDLGVVKVTPSSIRLVDHINLKNNLEILKRCYF